MEKIFFLIIAVLTVAAALNVILQRSPLYSAFSLIGVFACLAVIYVSLQAEFIATLQIIVYAGAIMVLFVFVIMLLNVRREQTQLDHYRFLYYLAVPLGALLFFEVYYSVSRLKDLGTVTGTSVGDSVSIGQGLFSHYLLPFEATSILILMAIVGSVIMAKRE